MEYQQIYNKLGEIEGVLKTMANTNTVALEALHLSQDNSKRIDEERRQREDLEKHYNGEIAAMNKKIDDSVGGIYKYIREEKQKTKVDLKGTAKLLIAAATLLLLASAFIWKGWE